MILATQLGNREVRMAGVIGDPSIPGYLSGYATTAGVPVTLDSASGLPAVFAAIRIVSELIGSLPLHVYQDDLVDPGDREQARTSWQWQLLNNSPNGEQSPFDFLSDLAASVESNGNAYVLKVKARGRIVALIILDPYTVQIIRDRDTKAKTFRVWGLEGSTDYSPADVLHVRGFTLKGGDKGLSPIQVCRNALGTALAAERFQSGHYGRGAKPGFALVFPENMTPARAAEWRQSWDDAHAGPENMGKTAVVGGGATLQDFPISLEDAQFVESQHFGISQVARMFSLPPTLLGLGGDMRAGVADDESERLLKFGLMPRLRRIELAFRADPDLFPAADGRFPEFLVEAIERASISTRYAAYKDGRQGGWLAPNEIRAKENYPPKDGGDDIQLTPVGGAPNTATTNGAGNPAAVPVPD